MTTVWGDHRVGSPDEDARVRALFAPLVAAPDRTAVLSDFDGTLAAIVDDPATARPLPGVRSVLAALAHRFATVAVISGRPAAFLATQLGGIDGLVLVGTYGFERVGSDGAVQVDPVLEHWLPVVADATRRLRSGAPSNVLVEDKGLSVTLHWRQAPEAEPWVRRVATSERARTGLVVHPGRRTLELRPPVPIDKGSAVDDLVRGCRAGCFLGDDIGDLAGFAALDRAASRSGAAVVKVVAADAESPPEVIAAADVVVDGPAGSLRLLRWLAGSGSGVRSRGGEPGAVRPASVPPGPDGRAPTADPDRRG